ncbi:MAG: excinuclease ABC subunit UvrC [Dethiobacter sp.]|jgi:excinuclease ABC subunit C|nr:excinuclease ABC subunit UvrC [Dethiobacter sp.]
MDKKLPASLAGKLSKLPRRPGVYLMKDERGKTIYVGKAVDLRQRVRSYFQAGQQQPPKVKILVGKICDVDYTVTDTEVEALILESNLIKENKPRYNINLKDDKHYPYLRVTVQEQFPRLHVARRVEKDGARYFGPYPNAGAVRETMRLIKSLFPLRHCRGPIEVGKNKRACLNRHIHRCLAPCTGEADGTEYMQMVGEILLFLEGKQEKLLKALRERMEEASVNLEFEKAARLRDQYRAVAAVGEKQKIAVAEGGDSDVLALACAREQGCVQQFRIRGGKLTGREHFLLTNPTGEEDGEVLAAFLRQYYAQNADIPPEILLSADIAESELLEQWLSLRRGRRARLIVPKRGSKKELVRLAADNARLFLDQEELKDKERDPKVALQALAEHLNLPEAPYRIEGYDISHFQGEGTVAAMVVFEGGLPKTSDYRRFRVRSVDKPDDYASMREALSRRFARIAAGESYTGSSDPFLLLPDLLLIDGGPGQLGVALQALAAAGLEVIPVAALAKEEELIYLPGRGEALRLPRTSPALQLLQRVRDEAHRFVVTYQRTLRSRAGRGSALLDVPGIGDKRRKALLRHFGSMTAIRRATAEELALVEGMTVSAAAKLYEYLHN